MHVVDIKDTYGKWYTSPKGSTGSDIEFHCVIHEYPGEESWVLVHMVGDPASEVLLTAHSVSTLSDNLLLPEEELPDSIRIRLLIETI